MPLRCVIVEDEPPALKRTLSYVQQVPDLELLQTFDNGLRALEYLKTNAVDLVFLDLHLDELSGIQLLESLEHAPQVIVTTAFNEYALKGYDLDVTDYLLKPFSLDRFRIAVDKVRARSMKGAPPEKEFLFVKSDYKIEKVFFRDILLIEGMRDYRCICLKEKKRILSSHTFTELESLLPADSFMRVHKSFMVSIDKIERIEKHRVLICDKFIPVSETYRDAFYKIIGQLNKTV